MVRGGMGAEEAFKSGKFSGRTFRSVDVAVKRLFIVPQTKKSFVPQIREAEIVGLETIVKHYLDAFNKICGLEQYEKLDLERFRIIFAVAWKNARLSILHIVESEIISIIILLHVF